ncbi:MAG: 2-oxoacid:acceptor oxidoreductase subunit alpha [Firmicutes bacterium]|nr:2-oxoacid:acceptor oxidoreductase subunit alpha [Bacillota bacterium]
MRISVTPPRPGTWILDGNQACVEGALSAGCSFFAGYPITPASEILEMMSYRLPDSGGAFIQMEDELASINATIGAAWGGAIAMTATSGPGFSLMQEGIGYAAVTETPCVIVNVQRGGPATGQPTSASQQDVMQARYGSHGDYEIPVFAPSTTQETFDVTVRAFNTAIQYRTPVVILTDATIARTREKVRIPDQVWVEKTPRQPGPPGNPAGEVFRLFSPDDRGVPPSAVFGEGKNLLVEGQLHDEAGVRAGHLHDASAAFIHRLTRKILDNAHEFEDVQPFHTEGSSVVVLSYGSSVRPSLEAVEMAQTNGVDVGCIKIVSLWPFPDLTLKRLLKDARLIIVPEMNSGRICREVSRVVAGTAKVVSLPKIGGELHTPREILAEIDKGASSHAG